jgi:all-trans-retinol 13,14-reductase
MNILDFSYRYFQNNIDYYSVGTPVTIEHFLSTKEGGIYGMAHGIERFCPKQSSLLRPESGIKGNNGQSNKR